MAADASRRRSQDLRLKPIRSKTAPSLSCQRGWSFAQNSFKLSKQDISDRNTKALTHLDNIVENRHFDSALQKRRKLKKREQKDIDAITMTGLVDAAREVAGHTGTGAPWYLLHPQSNFLSAWEGLGAVILGIVAIFTPFEVAFMTTTLELFIFGRVIDFYFLADMVLQFFTMSAKDGERNRLETSHLEIVKGYLQGWFFLDLVALSSSTFDIIPVVQSGGFGGATFGKKDIFATFRIVRVLRLIKLLRLLKASRIIKAWSVKIATPRATVTIVSALIQCIYVSHLFACALALVTLLPATRLDTWFSTLGYCKPVLYSANGTLSGDDDVFEECVELQLEALANGLHSNGEVDGVSCDAACIEPMHLYLQCMWWSLGMLMGAPISLTPHQGPYRAHLYPPDHMTVLTWGEQLLVLSLKCITAFLWTTVIARFVQVYNNLDPDARDFRLGWDALNRFVSYFKVPKADALELRRFYIERAEEARAKSRKKVMNDFSPLLAEKFVWKLNKEWLVRVPCFSLVVDRLLAKPQSGMERFLVKVALVMQPAVYVPTEKPPAHRLYIITHGVAIYKGKKAVAGSSWGAEDVLLRGREAKQCHRAVATTYLHVLWVGADTFLDIKELGPEFRSAYLLTKLWAMIYATGNAIVEQHRLNTRLEPIQVGTNHGDIWPSEVERRINKGVTSVVAMRGPSGEVRRNVHGQDVYKCKYGILDLGPYEVVKIWETEAQGFRYKVLPRVGTEEYEALDAEDRANMMRASVRRSVASAEANNASDDSCGLAEPAAMSSLIMSTLGRQARAIAPAPSLATSAVGLRQRPEGEAIAATERTGGLSFGWLSQRPAEEKVKPSSPLELKNVPDSGGGKGDVAAQVVALTKLFQQQTESMNKQLQSLAQQVHASTGASSGAGRLQPMRELDA